MHSTSTTAEFWFKIKENLAIALKSKVPITFPCVTQLGYKIPVSFVTEQQRFKKVSNLGSYSACHIQIQRSIVKVHVNGPLSLIGRHVITGN